MSDNTSKNEGIVITGGQFKAGDVAVGRNARVTKTVASANEQLEQKGMREIGEKLEALVKAVTEHAGSLENPDEVRDSTEMVAQELSKSKPNKLALTSILSGIASGVQSVTTVATAVEALKLAVTKLM